MHRAVSIRIGASAILPHGGNHDQRKVPAGVFVVRGFGNPGGLSQVAERGEIETPIVLTNTVGSARNSDLQLALHGHDEPQPQRREREGCRGGALAARSVPQERESLVPLKDRSG
jgi:L-aminopeptidase/D-esterase-like protein